MKMDTMIENKINILHKKSQYKHFLHCKTQLTSKVYRTMIVLFGLRHKFKGCVSKTNTI